ncbi:DUF3558 family protein [Streptomyces profundus]|uniref:DUF3558 family protein n=1 Tax=Streptomyces profundus TaxID=2867410 RepID=UPI001D15EE55|nr:DUF3558 family protein [Streptomyces sp. MA3_2.13]UED88161.1 DUF3558 domain-containing protein [Streptomyces sp. MA3_2.13]
MTVQVKWRSRSLVACGVAALLGVAGCSESGSPEPGGGASAGADEGAARGDAAADDEPEAERVEDAGFDPCDLLPPEEVAPLIGVDALYVTSRQVSPDADGGRLAGCSYLTEDVPGIAGMTVNVVAGTEREAFFAPFQEREALVVDGSFGDEQRVVAYETPDGSTHFRELRVIEGDTGFHIRYTYNDSPDGMPALDDEAMAEALALMTVAALDRLPAEVTIADGVPEGVCADIDLALASGALGEELTTARSVLGEGGALNCEFSGEAAALTVVAVSAPDRVAAMRVPAEMLNVADIGDGASVRILPNDEAQGPLDAMVHLGDRLVVVSAAYGPGAGSITAPRAEDAELVRDIAEAVR